ncbi:PREDICTED: ycf3-interacting protein 1, chloroplastic-like [Camelina sativa]|uniref:Ycf3-interacting protein 1, chloroplastic-like n=1 Tax=Camelina sativa TaxID=90675 RepID=A0ABM0X5D6_CAMSA|nr:PREDICTED: ycf3-interacting protein 1, chloroplastic-like [Camelina sativa]
MYFSPSFVTRGSLCVVCVVWVRRSRKNRRFGSLIAKQEKGDVTEIRIPVPLTLEQEEKEKQNRDDDDEYEDVYKEGEEVDPEDLRYVNEIKRVLELLRRNRDMIFSEVKLTIMIEDPREVERRRLLGIEDSETPSRDDLAEALEQVNDGKVPKDRATLRMLHEEMMRWPNLEVEVSKKQRGKSMYAKSTDTGIDPKEAAKRLNIEWDSAAAIEEADVNEEQGVVTKVAVCSQISLKRFHRLLIIFSKGPNVRNTNAHIKFMKL